MTDTPVIPPEFEKPKKEGKSWGQRFADLVGGLANIEAPSASQKQANTRIALWLITPLLIGWLASQALIPRPAVGIIRLNTEIWDGSAEFVMMQIEEARRNPAIKAVVLQLDSPGGEVVATQTLFLELQSLRKEMPLVSSINGVAASGAYYMAMATDPIYAKPSSTIGNIGVWGYVPPDLAINEVILASGPFKLTASNQDEFLREIEGIRLEFLETVESQRGDRLKITSSEITQGLAYSGRYAMELGLIDFLGSQSDAVAAAASLAGIANYDVIDLEAIVIKAYLEEWGDYLKPWVGASDPVTGARNLPPGIYLLYDVRIGGAQ